MIQANELRIGNWIQRRGKPIQVTGIIPPIIRATYQGLLSDYTTSDDQLQPIPLTPEILEKCGVVKTEEYNSGNEQGWQLYKLVREVLAIKGDKIHFWNYIDDDPYYSGIIGTSIKYVHQLQNVYYALTGDELEIML